MFTVPTRIPGDNQSVGQSDQQDEGRWMRLARDAYTASTDYLDANYRKEWEDALRMFDNKHPTGSKYLTTAYSRRSKFFRPKTRSMVRRHEAAASVAFFSNEELFDARPQNEADPMAAEAARLIKALMMYRLEHSIPWFMTCIGAIQDAHKIGVCCSYNYWKNETVRSVETVVRQGMDPETGEMVEFEEEIENEEQVEDKPCIDLFPAENLRFSPAANWIDPINTSPYVIRIVPMYAADVLAKIESGEWSGPESIQEVVSAGLTDNAQDSTRTVRQAGRQDPESEANETSEFTIVYPREVFIKDKGRMMAYWVLGDKYQLTEARPLKDVYLHGKIPITVGFVMVETHKAMPRGSVTIGAPTQMMINDVGNQRIDNVRLVLNKQWLVRSGSQMDTSNLVNNVPGGVTLVDNVETQVKPIEWNDVTGSSVQEHDRLNAEYDDVTGAFGVASVDTNRNMGETVGGMSMLKAGTDAMTEHSLRVFVHTWLIPTLNQLALLEQKYETDELVLGLAANSAQLAQILRDPEQMEQLFGYELYIRLKVGLQATDSNQKLVRFMAGLQAIERLAALKVPGANYQELSKELFSLLGYGEGGRFFNSEDFVGAIMQQAQGEAQNLMNDANQTAEQIIKQAQTFMDKAENEIDQARTAQRQLMNEEMQLVTKTIQTVQREFAVSLKELEIASTEDEALRQVTIESLEKSITGFDGSIAELLGALESLKGTDPSGLAGEVLDQSQQVASAMQQAMRAARQGLVDRNTKQDKYLPKAQPVAIQPQTM
jgi:hypothetical protein